MFFCTSDHHSLSLKKTVIPYDILLTKMPHFQQYLFYLSTMIITYLDAIDFSSVSDKILVDNAEAEFTKVNYFCQNPC